jgi:hypothetical protein
MSCMYRVFWSYPFPSISSMYRVIHSASLLLWVVSSKYTGEGIKESSVLNSGWFGYGSVGAVGFRWWQFGSNSLGWHVQFAALHFVHVVTSLEFAGGGSCSPSRCGHNSAWNCLWCTVARLMNLTSANLVCNSAALWVPCRRLPVLTVKEFICHYLKIAARMLISFIYHCPLQPMEIYVDDEAKLTLHGLVQVAFIAAPFILSFCQSLGKARMVTSHQCANLTPTTNNGYPWATSIC